jgi:hypothetical protein
MTAAVTLPPISRADVDYVLRFLAPVVRPRCRKRPRVVGNRTLASHFSRGQVKRVDSRSDAETRTDWLSKSKSANLYVCAVPDIYGWVYLSTLGLEAVMGLREWLDAGRMVVGSVFDNKIKPLGEMSERAQRREGYTDENGNWTDRGYDRGTSKDYANLERSRRARMKDE